jgi:RNA polymerase I-specific transcription initiation factor RRN3
VRKVNYVDLISIRISITPQRALAAPMVSLVPTHPSPAAAVKSSKPTKPVLRRATLSGTIRKADDAELDSDLPSRPSSPNKRARVTFNPNVEEKVMEEYQVKVTRRSLESVRSEVRRAIEELLNGNSEAYDQLKEVFSLGREGGEDEEGEIQRRADLKTYVIALTGFASSLNRNCNGLVKNILACEWMGRDEAFVKAYMQFLGSLVSAQGMYVGTVLGMLVGHFHRGKTFSVISSKVHLTYSAVRLSSGRLPGCPDVNRAQLVSRIHTVMKYLLRVIPSASATLSPILASKFPFPDETNKKHTAYIDNLLRVLKYAPELKSDIFALITDRLIKIDVQMQVDLDDLDDDVASSIVQALSLNPSGKEEEDMEDSDSEDSDSSEDDIDLDSKRVREIKGNVEKMDSILDLLFAIYSPYFSDPNSVEAAEMFDTLLSHFTKIILPMYRSRHTQFLLFHFAQTADHLMDQFAGTCVQLAFDPACPAVLRQSSASYLASFVARGAHVPGHVVCTVFELIGRHLDTIRINNELTCKGPDLKRYGTFYAMVQALLYIFCFRWRDLITSTDLLEDDDPLAFISQDLTWATGVKETLSNAIYSKLNPLKICSPPIVAEFAKIANHLRFLYIYPKLETNKTIRLSQFSSSLANDALRETGNGGNDESWHQLESYFPFDPYQLPVSKRWVEGDYVQWKGIPGLVQEEDDESGDEDEDDDAEVNEESATDGDEAE